MKKAVLLLGVVFLFSGSKAMALPGPCWCDVAYNGASAGGLIGNYDGVKNSESDCRNSCSSKGIRALSCDERADRYYKFRTVGSWTNAGNSVAAAACTYNHCKLVYNPGTTSTFSAIKDDCMNSPVNPSCGVTVSIYHAISSQSNANNVNNWSLINTVVAPNCTSGSGSGGIQIEKCNDVSNVGIPFGCIVNRWASGSNGGGTMSTANSPQCNVGPIPQNMQNCYRIIQCTNPSSAVATNTDQCYLEGYGGFDASGVRPVLPNVAYPSLSRVYKNVVCPTGKILMVNPRQGTSAKEDICVGIISHDQVNDTAGVVTTVSDMKKKTKADTVLNPVVSQDSAEAIKAPAVKTDEKSFYRVK